MTNNSPSCQMKRNDIVYTGCGFAYQTKTDRDTQCGSGGSMKFIPASNNSTCVINRGQTLYTGCGFIYVLKTDRDTQCGSGGTLKFIPSSIHTNPPPSHSPSTNTPSHSPPTNTNPHIDVFGFPIYNSNETDAVNVNSVSKNNPIRLPISSSKITLKKILLWISIVILVCIVLGMLYMSGYIAWNESVNDPEWLKISKTYIAVLFAPIYLVYTFTKIIILNLPR